MPLTSAGGIESQHWGGRRYGSLASDGAGSEAYDTPALPVHEAQASAASERLRLSPAVAGPARSTAQRRGNHKLRALGVKPTTVARVS